MNLSYSKWTYVWKKSFVKSIYIIYKFIAYYTVNCYIYSALGLFLLVVDYIVNKTRKNATVTSFTFIGSR